MGDLDDLKATFEQANRVQVAEWASSGSGSRSFQML
jgi:hypothetical protein